MVGGGGPLRIPDDEVAVLLVKVGDEEEIEEAPEDVEILLSLVVGDPVVPERLHQEADAVHLTVGAAVAAERPAEAVLADEVGQHLDVFLGEGPQTGEFTVAQALVGMELERLSDEDERHDSVKVEGAPESLRIVIKKVRRTGLLDSFEESFDQAAGLVLLGEAEAEAGDCFRDVKDLPVVVVITAVEQEFVEPLPGLVDQPLPDGIALL